MHFFNNRFRPLFERRQHKALEKRAKLLQRMKLIQLQDALEADIPFIRRFTKHERLVFIP